MMSRRFLAARPWLMAVAMLWIVLSARPALAAGAAALTGRENLSTPAGPGSRLPNLSLSADGGVLMSWMEPRRAGGMTLRFARFDGRRWSPPRTIAEGDSFFANWADFPSIVALPGKRLAAHWLWKSGAGTYAYDVRVSQSKDQGRTWSPPVVPHLDGTATEHGFVSLLPETDGVRAVWLDGRKSEGHVEDAPGPSPDMTLRTAVIGFDGRLRAEHELDTRTCDCCQTAAVRTGDGVLVAYRDRSAEEIRDIALVRLDAGRWSAPAALHADAWHMPGCPVNGPALSALGKRVAVAWYTAAAESARVLAAFSSDAGRTFTAPVRVDAGDPLGRVAVEQLDDGSALVCWVERAEAAAAVTVRRVGSDRADTDALVIAKTAATRASGFPRLLRVGPDVFVAWTENGASGGVRLARARIGPP